MAENFFTIPDIGNFDTVEVIEIHVNPGDSIKKDDSLITLESEKASMDIPSTVEGVVEKILLKVGDKVSKGDNILSFKSTTSSQGESKKINTNTDDALKTVTNKPEATTDAQDAYDLVVLGSGPGGYTAAFRAADLGLKVALVEKFSNIGGVCLNVGCIPSKALLHMAKVITEAEDASHHGITFGKPHIDLDKLRNWKNDDVVGKLTGGLTQMAQQRGVTVIQGYGKFLNEHTFVIEDQNQKTTNISFKSAIIAAGSKPIVIPNTPNHPNIIDSVQIDRAFASCRPRETCTSCGGASNIVLLHDTSDMVCDGCGQVVGTIICNELSYREEQESSTKIINYSYKRQNHFNEWLSQFQGAEMCTIPEDVVETLRDELKKQKLSRREDITHARVRALLKKLRMQKFYEHVPLLCCLLNGVRPPQMNQVLEQRLRLMFNQIQEPFDKVCPPHRKNFLSYSYTLYKLCELLGEDTYLPYFPLLKSKEKLHAMDLIWQKICDELRWEYIATI